MIMRTRSLWLCLLLLGILGVSVSFYYDLPVKAWVQERQTPSLQRVMRAVSKFGDWPQHVALGLSILGLAWWRKSLKWMRVAIAMILACTLAGAAVRVVKISTGRPRPSVQAEAAWTGFSLSSRYHAFPSGHAASSTAFFAVLAFASWRIGLPLMIIPILIAFSRIYVAAHYLSDVVCAALIGLLCAYLVTRWVPPLVTNTRSHIAK
jgi:membrane-associated phospholipid phosphatase